MNRWTMTGNVKKAAVGLGIAAALLAWPVASSGALIAGAARPHDQPRHQRCGRVDAIAPLTRSRADKATTVRLPESSPAPRSLPVPN